MLARFFSAAFIFAFFQSAAACGDSLQDAYTQCDLHHLDKCQNANQLFWGPAGKSGRASRKEDFRRALAVFLQNAPGWRSHSFDFTATSVLEEALIRGGPISRLSTGEWVLTGSAGTHAAVVVTPDGRIVLAAILDSSRAQIYAHGRDATPEEMTFVHLWALKQLGRGPQDTLAIPVEVWTWASANAWEALLMYW